MQRYKVDQKELIEPILTTACKGELESGWCISLDFDFDRVMNRIVEWMTRQKDWLRARMMLEAGERLSDDLEQHLKYFNMIARFS